MALQISYELTTAEIPAIQVPLVALDIADKTPTTAATIPPGGSADLSAFNKNAVRSDLLGRFGGGAIAVVRGLDLLQGSGLAAEITPGQAMIDGPVPADVPAANYSIALQGGSYNRSWFSAGGTVNKTANSNVSSPGGPPDALSLWCFLGTWVVAGNVTAIDYSGRMTMCGGIPYMRTADPGEPDAAFWTPPASLRYLHRSLDGLRLWDGGQFNALDLGVVDLLDALTTTVDQLRFDHDDLRRAFGELLLHLSRLSGDFIPPSLYPDLLRAPA